MYAISFNDFDSCNDFFLMNYLPTVNLIPFTVEQNITRYTRTDEKTMGALDDPKSCTPSTLS